MLEFTDGDAWESWLSAHHDREPEAWLRIGKKNAEVPLLRIGDALDGALCFGWIDGQRKGLDDVSFLQRYCPRTSRSTWSQVNVGKAEALVSAGRMRAAGLAEIERARADGRWDAAYASQRTAEPPPELLEALAADDAARAAFERLGRSDRYGLILPVLKATSPEARATSVARAVASLSERFGRRTG